MTVIIGKNDAGKSTILDALNLFLNEINPDGNDASIDGNKDDLTIICEFDEFPEEIILDDKSPTTFKDEYLLNENDRLEIHKTYSGNLQSPKLKSVIVRAIHPTVDGAKDLLQLKNRELRNRAREKGLDLSEVDQRSNVQLRAKIRESYDDLETDISMIQIDGDNKKIWDTLRVYLPSYALFKADRQSTDKDEEVQDPLKIAVKEAINEKEVELGAISNYVKDKVQEIADLTLEKLKEMDSTLATQLKPSFQKLKWENLFKASFYADEGIPINKRGSGVRRLILLNFFLAKAEQLVKEREHRSVIYAIEEPETSQHPNNQRMLARALHHLSLENQVIISTHTPMFARIFPITSLRYIHVCDDKQRSILHGNDETYKMIVKTLGVLPDNNVKLFIFVEGINDKNFLNGISEVLQKDDSTIPNLRKMEDEGELIYVFLGGSNLMYWVNRLEQLNIPEFHLIDRDCAPPCIPKNQRYLDALDGRERCIGKATEKREIENYLHKDAIIAAYKELQINLPLSNNYGEGDDVPEEIAKLVQVSESEIEWDELDDKKKGNKIRRVKKILCSIAPRYMTIDLLKEIEGDDLLSWFNDIRQLCEESQR